MRRPDNPRLPERAQTQQGGDVAELRLAGHHDGINVEEGLA